MIPSGESATPIDPAQAAHAAVKTYVRMNREKLAADGELLAMLLPERFGGEVSDLQRHVIDKLAAENQTLRRECDALRDYCDRSAGLGVRVRGAVLKLIEADNFAGVIVSAISASHAFGADRCAFCVESSDPGAAGSDWVHMVAPGTVGAVVGEGRGAILSGGGEILFGPDGAECNSLAAFRLRMPDGAPPLLYVLGAAAAGCFEGREIEADLRFFAQALERAIRVKANAEPA
jgi:hypothetical protein